MANEDELLRRLARAEANAYYVAPAGGINIPSGSFAGSTADTGIYQSRRPDPTANGGEGYLGGYSNVGSRKIIPAEPPTAPTREQILAEQIGKGKVAADILGALIPKKAAGSDILAGMQAQGKGGNMAPTGNDNSRAVEQTERMMNGLFQSYKQPIVKQPGVLPDIDISSDADQRAFFGSPDSKTGKMPDKVWSKTEIQKKQAAANKDAAVRYVGLINGIQDEGIRKAFINDIHPDVRRQVTRLMNTEKKMAEKQQAEVKKQVEKKAQAAENATKIKTENQPDDSKINPYAETAKDLTVRPFINAIGTDNANAIGRTVKNAFWDNPIYGFKNALYGLNKTVFGDNGLVPKPGPPPEGYIPNTIAINPKSKAAIKSALTPSPGIGADQRSRIMKTGRDRRDKATETIGGALSRAGRAATQLAPQGRPFDAARTALAPTRIEQAQLNATIDIINILSEINTGALAETDGIKAINTWIDYLESAMGPEQAQQAVMQIIDKVSTKSPLQQPNLMKR